MLKNGLNQTNIIVKGRNVKVTKSNENSTIFIGNIRKNWTNQDVETKVKRIVNFIFYFSFLIVIKSNTSQIQIYQIKIEDFVLLFLRQEMTLLKL